MCKHLIDVEQSSHFYLSFLWSSGSVIISIFDILPFSCLYFGHIWLLNGCRSGTKNSKSTLFNGHFSFQLLGRSHFPLNELSRLLLAVQFLPKASFMAHTMCSPPSWARVTSYDPCLTGFLLLGPLGVRYQPAPFPDPHGGNCIYCFSFIIHFLTNRLVGQCMRRQDLLVSFGWKVYIFSIFNKSCKRLKLSVITVCMCEILSTMFELSF